MINIKTDSRKIVKGDIFVALRGITSDGHDYIDRAIKNGASCVVLEKPGNYGIKTIVVKDTREYLNQYLYEHYGSIIDKMVIIGITGTNGKTTIAYLINEALNKLGLKSAYIGTIGFYMQDFIRPIPNTSPEVSEIYSMILEAYEKGCKYFIMEASSQGLANKRLETIKFDYAIFTNLTEDHLDFHKTMHNYALAKQLLFKKLKPNGKAIVNIDDAYKDYFLLKENSNITYGYNLSDYQLLDSHTTLNGSQFKYQHQNSQYIINTKLIGDYNVYNALVTAIILTELGIKQNDINKVMNQVESPKGRMDIVKYKKNIIVIDYAHTPDALTKVITTIKSMTKGNTYVVFGCTGDREREKRPIMTAIATSLVSKVIITSDDLHFEDPNQIVNDMLKGLKNNNYEVCMDRKEAVQKGIDLLTDNDSLLILGKGHEEAIVIGKERIPFNDKKAVLNYLAQKDKQSNTL